MKIVYVFGLALLVAACCKAYCDDESLFVDFQNFTNSETDTVYVLRYQQGTGQFIDTVRKLFRNSLQPSGSTSLLESLEPGNEWRIILPSINRSFYFKELKTAEVDCNCSRKEVEIVSQAKMNDSLYQGNYIRLQ